MFRPGNLSVSYIQASPIGCFPRPDYLEPPPSVESQVRLKSLGLVANEDYVAWGAVERAPGQWSMETARRDGAGAAPGGTEIRCVCLGAFPASVAAGQQKQNRTLMRCLEHGQEANYLSIFDPRTIQWYDQFLPAPPGPFR